ncbi:Adenylyl/guanylyl cyclase [Perkinsus olseni]|uniref:Adenylyl/guanylyl cyclase n=1 Tax=Perkinsus olseni TaxID=32597 RepID=A0A7J6S5E5_PEROL|nr:Adenylyl/guanylyl cyclase [Perkinsus olseni]
MLVSIVASVSVHCATETLTVTIDLLSSAACSAAFNELPVIGSHLQRLQNDSADNSQFITSVITIYALFGDDIRVSSTSQSADTTFDVLTSISLVIFVIEVTAASVGKEGYIWSFFFFLDSLSTASLILDLTFVAEALFGGGGGSSDARVARAGRASRAGTRAGRVVRIIRLIRLLRIIKLYKAALETNNHQHKMRRSSTASQVSAEGHSKGAASPAEGKPEADNNTNKRRKGHLHALVAVEDDVLSNDDKHEEEEAMGDESRVGKKLSELTTRKVILLVLAMLFLIPQFEVNGHFEDMSTSPQYAVDNIYRTWSMYVDSCIQLREGTINDTKIKDIMREGYERELLNFMYYHNPHSAEQSCPDGDLCLGHTYRQFYFWMSYHHTGPHDDECLNHPQPTLLRTSNSDDDARGNDTGIIEPGGASGDYIMNTGTIPVETLTRLAAPWDTVCADENGIILDDNFRSGDGNNITKYCPEEYLRFTERVRYLPLFQANSAGHMAHYIAHEDDHYHYYFEIIMDQRSYTQASAILNIIQTLFICVLLGGGALFFSKDANDLVLRPIERMANKMDKIRLNPLYATKLGDDEHKREMAEKEKLKNEFSKASNPVARWRVKRKITEASSKGGARGEPLETVILEKTIIKIGGLLAVGFGEAGTEVIGHNIRGGDSAAVDPMVSGSRVEAIIGFCDIRQFNVATEILQDKIMLFVNQIGEIVHGIADEYHGVANRNLGEAFLMVWRLPFVESQENKKVEAKRQKLADMSVMSFVKILVAINKSPVLAEYRHHPGLLERLGDDYRVTMGFGVHAGWAIEGAIGSEFKIDASYLSPNVNMASRLAAATKQYKTNILCSEVLIKNMCSSHMQKYCRVIDNVTVKGSNVPVRLYTIDVDYLSLPVADSETMDSHLRGVLSRTNSAQAQVLDSNNGTAVVRKHGSFASSNGSVTGMRRKKRRHSGRRQSNRIAGAVTPPHGIHNRTINKSKLRRMREAKKQKKWSEEYVVADAWENDEDLVLARKIFTPTFLGKFGAAYRNYEAGEWKAAASTLTETKDMLGYEDGPSAVLLKFMRSHDCVAPKDWEGYRALTEK